MDKLSAEEISEFREIFNLVDKDGGGEITKAELGELLDTLGRWHGDDQMDDTIFIIALLLIHQPLHVTWRDMMWHDMMRLRCSWWWSNG